MGELLYIYYNQHDYTTSTIFHMVQIHIINKKYNAMGPWRMKKMKTRRRKMKRGKAKRRPRVRERMRRIERKKRREYVGELVRL